MECDEILRTMPGHDVVIVEGYRKSGLPTIEIMRSGNDADSRVAQVFCEGAKLGWPLGTDFTQMTRGMVPVDEHDGDERNQQFLLHGIHPFLSVRAVPEAGALPIVTARAALVNRHDVCNIQYTSGDWPNSSRTLTFARA